MRYLVIVRKYSLGADVFRFAPASGHPASGLGCPGCARNSQLSSFGQDDRNPHTLRPGCRVRNHLPESNHRHQCPGDWHPSGWSQPAPSSPVFACARHSLTSGDPNRSTHGWHFESSPASHTDTNIASRIQDGSFAVTYRLSSAASHERPV